MTCFFAAQRRLLMRAHNGWSTGARDPSRTGGSLRAGNGEDPMNDFGDAVPLARTKPMADCKHNEAKGNQEEA